MRDLRDLHSMLGAVMSELGSTDKVKDESGELQEIGGINIAHASTVNVLVFHGEAIVNINEGTTRIRHRAKIPGVVPAR